MNNVPLIIEQELNATINQVWRTITEPELMKKWYFNISDFKLEMGAIFHFEGGKEHKRYTHECEILEIVPHKKLKYSWRYEENEGLSFVTFELADLGEKTTLKLTHENLDTFTNPDFRSEKFLEGWNYLIKESLVRFLDKGEALRYW